MKATKLLMGIIGLLLVTAFVYFPGLNSRFILDDVYNLHGLGDIEANGILYYVFGSGFSGPGGRPISLLSFALQYPAWPENPFAFKLVNLLLHLVNGVLICVFSIQITRNISIERYASRTFALIVTGLWLLHPIHVNTVLYTVQRMTEISAFFSLLGMVGYMHGRQIAEKNLNKGLIWIIFSILTCTVLAILSKENGILLTLYILAIELTIFSGQKRPKALLIGLWIGIAIPFASFLIYVLLNVETLHSAFSIREFTPMERVLTELTVLVNYIKVILIPHPSAFYIFHDGYPVSHGLFSPPFTFISLCIITSMSITSVMLRKKYPVAVLGVLIFFCGHLLEAGPVSLELYFEHRNYLPSLGIMILIVSIISKGLSIKTQRLPTGIFLGIFSLALAATTADQVNLWTTPTIQVVEWMRSNPDSDRAKYEMSNIYIRQGAFDKAEIILTEQSEKYSDDIYPHLQLIRLEVCVKNQQIENDSYKKLLSIAGAPLRYNLSSIAILDSLILDVISNKCPNLDTDILEDVLTTLINNPGSKLTNDILYEFLSTIWLYRDNLDKAVEYLQYSLSSRFDVERKLREIHLLGVLNRTAERIAAIGDLEKYLEENPKINLTYYRKIESLK